MIAKIRGFLDLLGVATVLIGLIGPLKDLVALVEDLWAGREKAGPEKKAFALEVLEKVLDAAEEALDWEIPRTVIMKFADALIDILVRVMKVVGFFQEDKVELGKKPPTIEAERLRPE